MVVPTSSLSPMEKKNPKFQTDTERLKKAHEANSPFACGMQTWVLIYY